MPEREFGAAGEPEEVVPDEMERLEGSIKALQAVPGEQKSLEEITLNLRALQTGLPLPSGKLSPTGEILGMEGEALTPPTEFGKSLGLSERDVPGYYGVGPPELPTGERMWLEGMREEAEMMPEETPISDIMRVPPDQPEDWQGQRAISDATAIFNKAKRAETAEQQLATAIRQVIDTPVGTRGETLYEMNREVKYWVDHAIKKFPERLGPYAELLEEMNVTPRPAALEVFLNRATTSLLWKTPGIGYGARLASEELDLPEEVIADRLKNDAQYTVDNALMDMTKTAIRRGLGQTSMAPVLAMSDLLGTSKHVPWLSGVGHLGPWQVADLQLQKALKDRQAHGSRMTNFDLAISVLQTTERMAAAPLFAAKDNTSLPDALALAIPLPQMLNREKEPRDFTRYFKEAHAASGGNPDDLTPLMLGFATGVLFDPLNGLRMGQKAISAVRAVEHLGHITSRVMKKVGHHSPEMIASMVRKNSGLILGRKSFHDAVPELKDMLRNMGGKYGDELAAAFDEVGFSVGRQGLDFNILYPLETAGDIVNLAGGSVSLMGMGVYGVEVAIMKALAKFGAIPGSWPQGQFGRGLINLGQLVGPGRGLKAGAKAEAALAAHADAGERLGAAIGLDLYGPKWEVPPGFGRRIVELSNLRLRHLPGFRAPMPKKYRNWLNRKITERSTFSRAMRSIAKTFDPVLEELPDGVRVAAGKPLIPAEPTFHLPEDHMGEGIGPPLVRKKLADLTEYDLGKIRENLTQWEASIELHSSSWGDARTERELARHLEDTALLSQVESKTYMPEIEISSSQAMPGQTEFDAYSARIHVYQERRMLDDVLAYSQGAAYSQLEKLAANFTGIRHEFTAPGVKARVPYRQRKAKMAEKGPKRRLPGHETFIDISARDLYRVAEGKALVIDEKGAITAILDFPNRAALDQHLDSALIHMDDLRPVDAVEHIRELEIRAEKLLKHMQSEEAARQAGRVEAWNTIVKFRDKVRELRKSDSDLTAARAVAARKRKHLFKEKEKIAQAGGMPRIHPEIDPRDMDFGSSKLEAALMGMGGNENARLLSVSKKWLRELGMTPEAKRMIIPHGWVVVHPRYIEYGNNVRLLTEAGAVRPGEILRDRAFFIQLKPEKLPQEWVESADIIVSKMDAQQADVRRRLGELIGPGEGGELGAIKRMLGDVKAGEEESIAAALRDAVAGDKIMMSMLKRATGKEAAEWTARYQRDLEAAIRRAYSSAIVEARVTEFTRPMMVIYSEKLAGVEKAFDVDLTETMFKGLTALEHDARLYHKLRQDVLEPRMARIVNFAEDWFERISIQLRDELGDAAPEHLDAYVMHYIQEKGRIGRTDPSKSYAALNIDRPRTAQHREILTVYELKENGYDPVEDVMQLMAAAEYAKITAVYKRRFQSKIFDDRRWAIPMKDRQAKGLDTSTHEVKRNPSTGEDYWVPKDISKMIDKLISGPGEPMEIERFVQAWERYMINPWKGWATYARPAFHLRNAYSNIWLMWMGGYNIFEDPEDLSTAFKISTLGGISDRLKPVSAAEIKETARATRQVPGATMDVRRVSKTLEGVGIPGLGEGEKLRYAAGGPRRGAAAALAPSYRSKADTMVDAWDRTKSDWAKESYTAAGGERYTGQDLYDLMAEYGVVSKRWMAADVDIDLVNKMDMVHSYDTAAGVWKALPFSQNSALLKLGSATGSGIENHARATLFVNAVLKQGMSPVDAAFHVKAHLFDYKELTVWERKALRRLFPFYAWARKATAHEWMSMVENPARYANLGKMKRTFEAVPPTFREDRPADADIYDKKQEYDISVSTAADFIRRKNMWLTWMTTPSGGAIFWDPNMPFQEISRGTSIMRAIPGIDDTTSFSEAATAGMMGVLEQMPPAHKLPIALGMGIKFPERRPLLRYKEPRPLTKELIKMGARLTGESLVSGEAIISKYTDAQTGRPVSLVSEGRIYGFENMLPHFAFVSKGHQAIRQLLGDTGAMPADPYQREREYWRLVGEFTGARFYPTAAVESERYLAQEIARALKPHKDLLERFKSGEWKDLEVEFPEPVPLHGQPPTGQPEQPRQPPTGGVLPLGGKLKK
jgi:hypothetical protein